MSDYRDLNRARDAKRDAPMTPEQVERDGLGKAMLAAWLNVRVDQIPPENLAHLNPHTMAAWERVGKAAIRFAAIEGEGV